MVQSNIIPSVIETILGRADAAFARKELRTTAELLGLASQLEPGNAALLNALASLQYQLEDYPGALENFRRQEQDDPQNADLQVQLGMTLIGLRDFDQAEAALRRALELKPGYPLAQKWLHDAGQARFQPPAPPRRAAAPSKYDLDHLTQDESQAVLGPIQDDEALFLYSVIRGMRLRNIFEIGGLFGYSATNFLRAVGAEGTVYTCDINPVQVLASNHVFIHKDAAEVQPADLDNRVMDLIFFDCHEYDIQMLVFSRFRDLGIIGPHTVLALHDTNTHPYKATHNGYATPQGFVHQPAERKMVNDFVGMGYHAFSLHTRPQSHSKSFPYRHGITVLTRFTPLVT